MQRYLISWKGHQPIILILLGIGSIAAALAIDLFRLGGQTSFGNKQLMLLSVGLVLLLRGVILATSLGRGKRYDEQATPLSRKWIAVLGGVNAAGFAAYAVLSYGMAPVVPFGRSQAHNAEFFDRLAEGLGFLGRDVQAFVSGQSILARQGMFLLAYVSPLLISTGVFLALLMLLSRHRLGLKADTPRLLFLWGVAFAALSALASPVLVHDFWYPLAWGRMVAAGLNPYYVDLTSEFTQALPLNEGHERMMYGPLLAAVSGVIMWLAGGHVLPGAVLFKLLLAGAWIGSLRLIWLLLRGWPVWHQCVGIMIFGWLPLSVMQAVADGHNDVLMVFLLLLWLYSLERGQMVGASISLAASLAIKYVTAPLFFLDVMHLAYSRGQRLSKYSSPLIAAAALLVLTFGLFFRSFDFFTPMTARTDWHFYSLREAVLAVELVMGTKLPFGVEAVRVAFPLLALYFIARYRQHPEPEEFRKAVLAVVSAMLFGYISGLWHWYLLWALGAAAVVPGAAIARWVLGVALATPFPILVWVVFPDINDFYIFDIPTLGLYTFAALWFIFAPRHWFPGSATQGEDHRIIEPLNAIRTA